MVDDETYMANMETGCERLRDENVVLHAKVKRLQADRDACIEFIQTEMRWCKFRADQMRGPSFSEDNAWKLEEFLKRHEAASATKGE